MRTIIAILLILIFAGFIPLSCCKNEGGTIYKMDFTKFNAVHYLTSLNLYDSTASQTDFDTIRNSDSLYLLANIDIKKVALLNSDFSFTSSAYACKQSRNVYELKYVIDSIVLKSNQMYNGVAPGNNLYYRIVENAQSYINQLNSAIDFNQNNFLFKINAKPRDNSTHQFTLKVYKNNNTIIEQTLKTFIWL